TSSYIDTSVVAGHAYSYKVQAFNNTLTSAFSNTATITAPAAPDASGISITTRFGNELVITATGANDSILVSQSDSGLTITADGQVFTQSLPTAGVFIYARGGSDSISLDSSVLVRTTIETIDAATTVINSAGANVSAWIDSTDNFSGSGFVHSVSSFA